MKIPRISLSHGQAAWVINLGQDPSRSMLNQLNYVRQRGIPHEREARPTPGSGNRLTYSYVELVEMGIAHAAFQRGMKFVDLEKAFVVHRRAMHGWFRQALKEQPVLAITASWVKSRGREIPILEKELLLTIHDRHSEKPGLVELQPISTDPLGEAFQRLRQPEIQAGLITQRVIPLTRLAMQWAAWAVEVPEIRPGPKTLRLSEGH